MILYSIFNIFIYGITINIYIITFTLSKASSNIYHYLNTKEYKVQKYYYN